MEKLPTLLSALQRHNVEYALVGAAALGVHGLVRATEDIDLFVRPEPANVASLKAALRDVWNDPAIDEISAADLAGDYPTVRYGTPDEDMVVASSRGWARHGATRTCNGWPRTGMALPSVSQRPRRSTG